jgi:replicative DNA helicase
VTLPRPPLRCLEISSSASPSSSESGSIEQDADLVMFIYRDEYYNDESDQQGIAEVHLAKHRNGPTDTVKLSFLKRYAKFADLAPAG